MSFNTESEPALAACHHCDLLMQRPALHHSASASCPRCGSTLSKSVSAPAQKNLALILTGLIMLWPAYTLPMLSMEVLGRSNSANLIDSVIVTWNSGYLFVSIAIALFCLIFPALSLALLLLLQRQLMTVPIQKRMLKSLHFLHEWSMLDIYLLGLLVSVVKVQAMAGLELGPGLLCFVILMISLFVALSGFSAEDHWQRLEAPRP